MPGPGTWSAGDVLTAADLNAIGVWTSYTPTVFQPTAVTATVNYAEYVQINKMVVVNVDITVTGTGTANTQILVDTPVNANFGSGRGGGFFFDSSANDVRLIQVNLLSTTRIRMFVEAGTSTSDSLGLNPNLTLGNGDVISFTMTFEAE
jgi:hypothetical protein